MLDLDEEENFLSFFELVLSWYWIWGVFISKALGPAIVTETKVSMVQGSSPLGHHETGS